MKPEQIQICTEALAAKGMLDNDALLFFAKKIMRPPKPPSGLKQGRPTLWPDAAAWDWTKSDIETAREKRIGLNTVGAIRRRLGIKSVPAPQEPSRLLAERKLWDWTKSDSELGREHGITRERSRQIRAQLGLPARGEYGFREREFLAWVAGRKTIVHLEALKAGFLGTQVKGWCEKNGIVREFKKRKGITRIPWDKFNWELPNWALSEVWNLKTNVCASRRSTSGAIHARYVKKANRASIQPLIDAEKAKVT